MANGCAKTGGCPSDYVAVAISVICFFVYVFVRSSSFFFCFSSFHHLKILFFWSCEDLDFSFTGFACWLLNWVVFDGKKNLEFCGFNRFLMFVRCLVSVCNYVSSDLLLFIWPKRICLLFRFSSFSWELDVFSIFISGKIQILMS